MFTNIANISWNKLPNPKKHTHEHKGSVATMNHITWPATNHDPNFQHGEVIHAICTLEFLQLQALQCQWLFMACVQCSARSTTHTHIYTHAQAHTHIYTHTHKCTHTYIHTRTSAHTHIYTHAQAHTHIYTHARASGMRIAHTLRSCSCGFCSASGFP